MFKYLWNMLFGAPCKHEWEILYESDNSNEIEKALEFLKSYDSFKGKVPRKWVFVVTNCKKCGATREYRD